MKKSRFPKNSQPGSASYYGGEESLQEALRNYQIHPVNSPFYANTKNKFLETIRKRARDRDVIIDIGCSFGPLVLETAEIYQSKGLGIKIYGIDINKKAIENARQYAKQEGITNIEFFTWDARNLAQFIKKIGIKPNKFTSFYAFHHIPDGKPGLLEEKISVLKQCAENSAEESELIMGDIIIPISFTNPPYLIGINQWGKPRIKSALKSAGKKAAVMEANAQEGIMLRQGEYPITRQEMLETLARSGWNPAEEIDISYTDAPKTEDIVLVAVRK